MAATLHSVAVDPLVERPNQTTRGTRFDRVTRPGTAAEHAAPTQSAPAAAAHHDVPEDSVRALNAVRSIVRALRINTRAMELRTGMSLAQIFVLQELARTPVHSLNDLAQRTATHQSSVSVVVSRLLERGLLTRTASNGDHRRVEIAITDAGRELLARTPTTVQAQLAEALTQMDDARRRSLAELLETWLAAAKIDLAAPAAEEGEGRTSVAS